MTKLWINTSSSNSWHGNAVGIIRVEKELILRIRHEPFEVDGFGFTRANQNPCPVDEMTERKVIEVPVQLTKLSGFIIAARLLSRKHRILKMLGFFVSLFYGLNSKLDKSLDNVVHYAYSTLRNIFAKQLEKNKPVHKQEDSETQKNLSAHHDIKSPFGDGDIVFTCGLDWDNSILEKMQSIKGRIDFKLVTVLYDLVPLTNPELIQNTRHVNRLLGHFTLLAQLSDLVLVNTNSTLDEFRKFCSQLEIDPPEVRLVPWGSNFSTSEGTQGISELLPIQNNGEYFLSVGTIEIRKNYQLLVNIIKLAREKGVEIPHFVFVGTPGWGTQDLIAEIENDEYLQKSITWLRNVSDAQLKVLYQNCIAVLSPSYSEGFGLPVCEAQYFKKPTYLSDIPVYRELFPNSTFISPHDPAAWLRTLTQKNHSNSNLSPILNWNESSKIVAKTLSDFFGTKIKYIEM
jgi:glycosyltransferase involved in cell wall biosynthesis